MRLPLVAALVLVPSVASAHISISSPRARTTEQKEQHCGQTTATNARANVHTALSGSTLHLVWAETIQHPGYFRVSFNQNGDTFRIPAAGAGTGGFPTEDLTGMMDPGTSGSLIIADRIPDGSLAFDVVLPDVECTNCTLQLIQLMTDKAPYTIAANSDDIYFQCVDLVLSRTAPVVPDGGTTNPGTPDAGTGEEPGVTSGGCSTGGNGAGGLALLGLGLAFGLRRRRAAATR